MQISCLQEDLSRGLSIAGRVTSTRTPLPVLENILIEASEGAVRLVCTNLDISINVWIQAEVKDPGSVTVPVRLLTDFVSFLPAQRSVELVFDAQRRQVEVRSGSYNASFNTIDTTEFPPIPAAIDESLEQHSLSTAGLRRMIDQTVFAAASGEERPNLAGVETSFGNGGLTMAATDGFRLSVCKADLGPESESEVKVLVPAKALAELSRVLSESDRSKPILMSVTANSNQILFEVAGLANEPGSFTRILLISQLIDGMFPDYSRIVPKEEDSSTRAVSSVEDLLRITRAAFLFSREGSSIVSFSVSEPDKAITVSSESADRGESENSISSAVEGETMEISFNGKYVIDFLSNARASEVKISMSQAQRPCAFKPVGEGDIEFLHVIMPMSKPRSRAN